MPMQTAQDLFLYELGDIYDAEGRIAQMLPSLASECTDAQVRNAFQYHEQQTRQQIQNLSRCFQLLGTQPPSVTCAVVQGLKQEHDSFLRENPTPDVLTVFDLGAGAKTEHYEIASYQGLVEKASMMGQQQIARLLQQNLSQEQEMAQKVSQLSQMLGQQQAQAATP